MAARSKEEAMRVIKALDLRPYIGRALKSGALEARDAERAEQEYRQFMLLAWTNQRNNAREPVVPTQAADMLWHEHILDTKAYRNFCNALTGAQIDHTPGLERGTPEHRRAADHTRSLHQAQGQDSFTPVYLAATAGASCTGGGCGAGCAGGCGGG